jgi:uncharacterized protein YbjT (DUF2867 family)
MMILVNAATGTVGSHVVYELLKFGVPVRAGVHSRLLEIDGVESPKIDFNRPETMVHAFEGVRDIFTCPVRNLARTKRRYRSTKSGSQTNRKIKHVAGGR